MPELLADGGVPRADGGHDPARAADVALRAIRDELRRHPAITDIEGRPHDELYTELRASVEPAFVGTDAPAGRLTVRWSVRDPGDPPRFVFHYADESGFDCGWHHHQQNHVDGRGQYQERFGDGTYSDHPFEFDSTEPARIAWEVLSELEARLERLQ